MKSRIDDAIEEITKTLQSLQADALEEAKEKIADDAAIVDGLAFGGNDPLFDASVNGVDVTLNPRFPPLSVLIIDRDSRKPIRSCDAIQWAIDFCDEDEGEREEGKREWIANAIAALQSGIDRLRTYEAERIVKRAIHLCDKSGLPEVSETLRHMNQEDAVRYARSLLGEDGVSVTASYSNCSATALSKEEVTEERNATFEAERFKTQS